MKKNYQKPAISMREMQVEHALTTNSDPTKVEVGTEPTKPEDADAKQVEWVDYLEE